MTSEHIPPSDGAYGLTAPRPMDRITSAGKITGRPRTSLPARTGRHGSERWRYPEGDDPVVVRGED